MISPPRAAWRATAVSPPVTQMSLRLLEAERAAHDLTRRHLAAAQARIQRLRDELAAARAGTHDAREAVIKAQSLLLDTLQAAQWARDTEMAEHLNNHLCTPKAPPATTEQHGAAKTEGAVRW